MVKGTVVDWDKPQGKLVVGDLSDLDPDQMSRSTGEIDYNKSDAVYCRTNNGCMYTSFKETRDFCLMMVRHSR